MTRLGAFKKIIRADILNYILLLTLGVVFLISSLILLQPYWQLDIWFIAYFRAVVFILGLVFVLFALIKIAIIKYRKQNIEVYEAGIKINEFIGFFDELTLIEKSNGLNTFLEFRTPLDFVRCNFIITKKDLDIIKTEIQKAKIKKYL